MERKYFHEVYQKTDYFDKHGVKIEAGMTLRHNDGEKKKVHICAEEFGYEGLGFLASNLNFLKHHPDWPMEYYSLSQFNLAEWEIVQEDN